VSRSSLALLAIVTALSLAAMAVSLLFGDWLYDLYWYWWVPLLGLGSLSILIWKTRRWWLLALVPIFFLPLLGLIYFNAVCMRGGGNCM